MKHSHAHEKVSRQEMAKALRRILGSSKNFLWAILVSALCVLAAVVLSIYAPQILKQLTDEIADNAGKQAIDMDKILRLGLTLGGFYIATALLNYASAFLLTGVTQKYANSLRKSIVEKINVIPLSYFDSRQIGDILSRVTNDVDSIAQSLDQTISMLMQAIFMLIGSLIGMFATSWQMALTALISIPLMLLFILMIMKLAMPQFLKRQEQIGIVNGAVEEKFSGQLVIKLFNADDRENGAFEEKNQTLGATMFRAQFFGGLMQPLMSFISYFAYIAVLVVGGLLIASGPKTGVGFGTIAAFLVYVRLFQQPMTQIAQAMNTLQTTTAASKRVFDFLEEKEMSDESNKKRYFPVDEDGRVKVKGEVEFRHVCFSYDETREIIHDFSAKIKPGSKVAIVGPTGAGKTTMVNLLMRFYEINSGDILIDGISTKDMSREEIHDIFGMVLQDTWVFDGTMRDNLIYNSPRISDDELKKIAKEANIYHFIRTLPGKFGCHLENAGSISAGQKQLMTIARAMVRKAPLLILDEATSNVDTRTEELIQEAMDNLTKGRTSFVIAHRLSTIKNADLILVMRDGNIVEQGTHESLMAQNGFYASLYNSQFSFE